MRIVTLLFILLFGSLGFSQNGPIDFEPGGFGDSFTWATFETPMGETDPTLTIVANPSVDATNGSANVAKFEVTYASTANWGQAGCETMHGADVGTFVVTAANSRVRMQIYQEGFASPVAVKFATPSSAAYPEVVVNNTVADAWVEVVFDMSQWIGATFIDDPDQFIFFPSYAPRSGGHTVYFDNVEFIAGAPAAGDPMTSAPDPTIDESKVMSVYSNYYTMNTVTNFNFNAFAGGVTVSEVDIESDGNMTGKLEGLDFYGAGWDAVDLSSYVYVHLDYYATTSSAFNFYLIDATAAIPGGNPEEPRYAFAQAGGDAALVQGQWVSVFIPLQHFLDHPTPNFSYDLNDIFQYKFDGNGTVYFDNIYFTTDNTVSNIDLELGSFNLYPNPTQDSWTLATEDVKISSIQVIDITGKSVMSISLNNVSEATIDGSNLKAGLYFAQVTTPSGVHTIKLVKE